MFMLMLMYMLSFLLSTLEVICALIPSVLISCLKLKTSIDKKLTRVIVKVKKTQRLKILFVYLGDVLMTLEDVGDEIKWCSVLMKIKTEAWYKSGEKWNFVFGFNYLEPNNLLKSNNGIILIKCIKMIVPRIIFITESKEFIVSVPFESCKSHRNSPVYLHHACEKAHERLMEMGIHGYGTSLTEPTESRLCPFELDVDTYDFLDNVYDIIDIGDNLGCKPTYEEYEDIIITAVPRRVVCSYSHIRLPGPLRIGEQPSFYRQRVSLERLP
jgi:hypothetical protein